MKITIEKVENGWILTRAVQFNDKVLFETMPEWDEGETFNNLIGQVWAEIGPGRSFNGNTKIDVGSDKRYSDESACGGGKCGCSSGMDIQSANQEPATGTTDSGTEGEGNTECGDF